MNATAATHTLDASGLLCPLPVIRVQDRIKGMASGEVLEVLATDPGTRHDIPAWCRVHGHQLVESKQNGEHLQFRILVS